MNFRLCLLVIAMGVFSLGSCTRTPELSGGSSDHENVLEATVMNNTGSPVKNASVRLVAMRHWAFLLDNEASVVVDTASTDLSGTVFLDSMQCVKNNFDMDADGQNVNMSCADIEDFGIVRLRPSATVYGVTTPNLPIAVYGTTIQTTSDENGIWSLQVPPGDRNFAVFVSGYWRPAGHISAKSLDSVEFNIPENKMRFLVENFESGENVTLFHFWNGGGRWWTAFDSIGTEEVHIIPDSAATNLMSAREYIDSLDSYVLHVDLIPNDLASIPKAMIGFNLGQSASTVDTSLIYKNLSFLDSLRLDMQGYGTIYVQLICQAEDQKYTAVFESPVDLTENVWNSYSLAVNDFKKLEGNLLDNESQWDAVKTKCKSIAFYARDSTDLWIDNIELDGIRLQDIE